jgi:uncharacterized phiE125 gp8 family phage protein
MKAHLRIDLGDEDSLITSYIGAATRACEEATRRQFMPATWRMTLDEFPDGDLNSDVSPGIEGWDLLLPRPPLVSVTSVTYKDTAGATQTFSSADYKVLSDDEPGRIVLAYGKEWPDIYDEPGAVVVTYAAGYADAASVPEPIKQAIRFLVGHFYENREAVNVGSIVNAMPMAVESLLGPFILQEQW